MLAQQTNVDVIANNIANMNTTGYKRFRPEFQDLLYQNLRRVGAESSDSGTIVPNGVQIGVGVKTASVYRITEQGNLISTGNTFDIAIQGNEAGIRNESGDSPTGCDRSIPVSTPVQD